MLSKPAEADWMQNVAMEMNLAETAFLVKQPDGYNLRWFTPTVEVKLCGHATLASGHCLWEQGYLKPAEQARFHTLSGLLTADKRDDTIELNFPVKLVKPAAAPQELLTALNAKPVYTGLNEFDYLLELDSEATVRQLKPDFGLLRKFPVRGVIVTARASSSPYDFISRFFAPGSGIDEDPVTGSAHCALGPYWQSKLNKNTFIAFQASPRGGVLYIRVDGERIYMKGKAMTMIRGELL